MSGLSNTTDLSLTLSHTHPVRGITDAARLPDGLLVAISFIAMGLLALFLSAAPANAQPPIYSLDDPHKITRITIAQNKSTTVQFGRVYKEVLIGNEMIADVVPLTDKSLYILGKAIGMTRLVIIDEQKVMLGVIEIEVSYDVVELERQLLAHVPNSQIKASSVNGKIMLSGLAVDAPSVAKAVSIAKQFAPESAVTNAISVNTSQQVLLEVRFLEVSRTAGRDLGVNWLASSNNNNFLGKTGNASLSSSLAGGVDGATSDDSVLFPFATKLAALAAGGAFPGGGAPFGTFLQRVLSKGITADVIVQALEERGLARRLAEPNLVALSGDTASFLAGGEFPFPVPQGDDTITIQFKKFGVGLSFTPTVLANGMINLKIEPEVSELDPASSVSIGGSSVPGLIVRRASTTLELRDGQSFAMAGLLQFNNRKLQRQIPWVGQVPIIGALFRSASYQKNESDLVIMVTPRLVKPAAPSVRLVSPLEGSTPTNDVEFFLLGKQERWNTRVRRADIEAGHNIDFDGGEDAYKGGSRGSFK